VRRTLHIRWTKQNPIIVVIVGCVAPEQSLNLTPHLSCDAPYTLGLVETQEVEYKMMALGETIEPSLSLFSEEQKADNR
jgi:hypothetical protein